MTNSRMGQVEGLLTSVWSEWLSTRIIRLCPYTPANRAQECSRVLQSARKMDKIFLPEYFPSRRSSSCVWQCIWGIHKALVFVCSVSSYYSFCLYPFPSIPFSRRVAFAVMMFHSLAKDVKFRLPSSMQLYLRTEIELTVSYQVGEYHVKVLGI
jgi:hypothetical protein